MKSARMVLAALLWLAPATALAHGEDGHPPDPNLHVNPSLEDCSVEFAPGLTQGAYSRFVREFGSVSAFKLTAPPTTLGKKRVALTLEYMAFTVEERADAWNDTFAHPDAYHELGSDKRFPKARLRVGVSDNVDIGAYYTRNPNANYGWLGLEGRYGLMRQSETTPIGMVLRGAYTKTLYVTDMDMHTLTVDLAAGRTFWNSLTPYLSVGGDLVYARETSDAVELKTETEPVPHLIGGLEYRVWHVGFGAEAYVGALWSYHFQVTALF